MSCAFLSFDNLRQGVDVVTTNTNMEIDMSTQGFLMKPSSIGIGLILFSLFMMVPKPAAAQGTLELRVVFGGVAFPGETVQIYVLTMVSGTLTDTRVSGRVFTPDFVRGQKPDSLTFAKIWTGIFEAKYDLDTNAINGDYLVMVEGDTGASHATGAATFKVDSELQVLNQNVAEIRAAQTTSNATLILPPATTQRASVDSSLGLREGTLTSILLFAALLLLIVNLGIQLRRPRIRLPKPSEG